MKLFGKRKPTSGSRAEPALVSFSGASVPSSVLDEERGLPFDPSTQDKTNYRVRNSSDYRYAHLKSFAQGHADSEDLNLEAVKESLRQQWAPEYQVEEFKPPSDNIDTVSERATVVSLPLCLEERKYMRKTKILCTMGPKCWSEETIGLLLDSGMDIARLNFSHGDHEAHGAVFDRFKKCAMEKGGHAAILLDTKGPEIRTAMLRDHKPITLEAGQPIIVEAVGDRYTEFEGYKTPEETRIGLSYAKLCSSVHPGNMILLADGSISIRVEEVLNGTELRGTVMNSKSLGERKNCNLPGVKVDIPVLTEKDIHDLQEFGCKKGVDFVAASFVQSKEDVAFVRRVLDEAGGQNVKIISKIENQEGLRNFDDILKVTDGVMVARGDLGMEIPSEKVPIAQKLLITKCNVAGKFVICATQMLESMIESPRPTRAEMTDVANAVYDGADAVMLSGESANGSFPATAVRTMASIVSNAEMGINYQYQYSFIRNQNVKGGTVELTEVESTCSAASKIAVSFQTPMRPEKQTPHDCIVVVLTEDGEFADLVSKYRPPCPVFVASPNEQVLRHARAKYGQMPIKVPLNEGPSSLVTKCVRYLGKLGHSVSMAKGLRAVFVGPDPQSKEPFVRVIRSSQQGLSRRPSSMMHPSGTMMAAEGDVVCRRSTNTNLELISKPLDVPRATNVICTMGPKCWDEATISELLDAGMDCIRLNFSHGDHKGHLEVLERFRKVASRKGEELRAKFGLSGKPYWASLLDTKGPEIRTAMLRDHAPIMLEAGQEIMIHAVGDRYTEFEGYKTKEETVIGLSYGRLCQSVEAGNTILLADGSISIEVISIVSRTVCKGRVNNSAKLGERKNCNLPGVKVDLPVLTDKDIDDLVNFACRYKMDYVAVSFVQSAEDVHYVRDILDENGGKDISIICKIENAEGLKNFDEILALTDGVMVARGDLGMEIPPEKVPFAQKMMITKCNLRGKMVVTATQMLESMIHNPRPTRAEMTDVANAVLDGTDCVMLSGETANGDFPVAAAATMAAICQNAEQMVDIDKRYKYIHDNTPKPMHDAEAVTSASVQCAMDMGAKAIIVLTTTGRSAALVAKYKPNIPVFVYAKYPEVAKQCRTWYGTHGVLSAEPLKKIQEAIPHVQAYSKMLGVEIRDGDQVVFVCRRPQRHKDDSQRLVFRVVVLGSVSGEVVVPRSLYPGDRTIFYRSTKVGLDTLLDHEKYKHIMRKTKIVCTMGPKCWSEEGIAKMLDAGMNIARFNFSHGDHAAHLAVLERFRKVTAQKNSPAGCFLDTKGPEIRTAMLRDHQPITLEVGQPIIVEAVGDRYTEFEGYKTPEETRIGLSYAKLCSSVHPGNMILLADGSISIRVEEVLNGTELRGTVMNSKSLGERKNCNLPGVKVDIPVLTEKDIHDLQNFCCKYKMDFVAASFVQSAEDVAFVRRVLDEAGGQNVKIISKIENQEGLKNYDAILLVSDGIMVARGDLGMEIPPEKVTLAQKYMVTRANITARFVICATQMLESMVDNYSPTRAEMTDVANAVFDGVDAVMLSGETANGAFPAQAVDTMARICRSAEIGVNYYQAYDFIRSFTAKPNGTVEAVVSTLAKTSNDIKPGMIVMFSEGGKSARIVAKYRPSVPVLVVTSNKELARHCQIMFGLYTMILDHPVSSMTVMKDAVHDAMEYGRNTGLCVAGKEVVVLFSSTVTSLPDSAANRQMYITRCPGSLDKQKLGKMAPISLASHTHDAAKTLSMRSTIVDLPMLFESSSPVRKTKIIASLGPQCRSEEMVGKLIDAGMDVARINMVFWKAEEIKPMADLVRKVAASKGTTVAILVDTRGPEIRTCYLVDGPTTRSPLDSIALDQGQTVVLTAHDPTSDSPFQGWKTETETRIPVNYPDLALQVKAGTTILINDGDIRMEVTEVLNSEVKAVVLNDSKLKSWSSINLLGITLNLPIITERDRHDLSLAVDAEVDIVAASFVRSKDDLEYIKDLLIDLGGADVKMVAKIETIQALTNLDEILEEADGVMVARGDLGTHITPEKVFLAQNMITTKATIQGKFVILARHCLQSMVSNPRPTRAEMTDVANAVLDGVHCVMLSAETAIGAFPAESVSTVAAIARNAEAATNYHILHNFIRDVTAKPFSTEEAVAAAAAKSPLDRAVQMVVVVSETGKIANLLSKFKASVPILLVTTDPKIAAAAKIMFAMYPCLVEFLGDRRDLPSLIRHAVAFARNTGVYTGGSVAVLHGANEPDTEIEPVMQLWSQSVLERLK